MALHPLKKAAATMRRAFATAALAGAGIFATATPAAAGQPEDIEAELNAHYQASPNPFYDRAIVLDPDHFDEKITRGAAPHAAMREMLEEKGVASPDRRLVDMIMRSMLHLDLTPRGAVIMNVEPSSYLLPKARLCILVPAPEAHDFMGPDYPIPGLTGKETVRFLNEHEKWHCKDRVTNYIQIHGMRLEVAGQPLAMRVHNEGFMQAVADTHRAEVLGDVGAVGDMIRKEGWGVGLTDIIGSWRQRHAFGDPEHAGSVAALWVLREQINILGLDGFRALDDAHAEGIYNYAASNCWLCAPRAMQGELIYLMNPAQMDPHLRMRAEIGDRDARNILLVHGMQKWSEKYGGPGIGKPPADPEQAMLARMAENWDADAALKSRALSLPGERGDTPTRGAIHDAYRAMKEEMREKLERNPDNIFFAEQSARLRTAFVKAVLGVRIDKVGPKEYIIRNMPKPAPAPPPQ